MINDQDEIGHFTPCKSVSGKQTQTVGKIKDTFYLHCSGPYETTKDGSTAEPIDGPCYKFGDTHNGLAKGSPNEVTGCADFFSGGDLDFDGSTYQADYPDSTTVGPSNRFPTPFLQDQPTTGGQEYTSIQFMTDITATEFNSGCNLFTGSGCVMPPQGAKFYPYWTQAMVGGSCEWEFGNMTNGNTFSGGGPGYKQYGSVGPTTVGAFVSSILPNTNCTG
jgi:hypothetical protein